MTVTEPTRSLPPEAELQFDIGATDDSLDRMIELFARYGDTYRVFSPARKTHIYVVHHPDDVKRVLVSNHRNYTKGMGLDRVKILLGKGLMTSEGELWKRQRYMMQPLFHRRVITEFAQTLQTANEECIARWERLADRGEPINITDEMSELTLNIVLRSIFGRDLDRMSELSATKVTPFGARAASAAGDFLQTKHSGNPFDVVTKDQERNLQFAFKFRSLTKIVAGLIEHRRAESEQHFDYVAMLMAARDKETGAPMSDRELIDEIMTLVVAGHETTASGLNWTWYLLSQNPQVEARLHAELDAVPDMPTPSLAQVESLAYAQQVVNEALRLYPPGWLLSRRNIEADVLGGYDVPPGTNVLLPLYLLHRDGRFWKDPDRFWPERFAPEHEAERPRFAYMPFAAGPRHCIGETFALYEMLMHLYKVARRYRLTHVPDKALALEAQINLRTLYPLYMRLERR
jgi:enediyne biosynthesis protein E7